MRKILNLFGRRSEPESENKTRPPHDLSDSAGQIAVEENQLEPLRDQAESGAARPEEAKPDEVQADDVNADEAQARPGLPTPPKLGLFERMRQAVVRTRENLNERIDEVVSEVPVGKEIDREVLDMLEATLLGADLGTRTTKEVLDRLREKADRRQIASAEALKRLLKDELLDILTRANIPPIEPQPGDPEVILVVGVNGTGKTTSIGKLAFRLKQAGNSVLLAAGDTFRAAAIEQLEVWGERTDTEVIKTKPGGDPAAVLFDALQAAKARNIDYVIVDTAGRLHTKTSLMEELTKMRRTAQRFIPGAPHETLLVIDATTGQNGLQQAKLFTDSAGVTGIVLSKLDGTAKGGVVVAISRETGVPVRYVGVGEQKNDLLPFAPKEFVDSLFAG